MQAKRNYGIDLLRIVSMFMVLILHILGGGGVLKLFSKGSTHYQVTWYLELMCYCAVNCYALISGFVGYKANFKFRNILKMWLQVFFWSVGVTVVVHYLLPDKVTVEQIHKALLPVSSGKFWYYTAYFCMSFFIPIMNKAINELPKRTLAVISLAFVSLLTVYPTVKGTDLFQTEGGYSVIWLMALYIIGGYLGKYPFSERCKPIFCFLIYFVAVTLTWKNKMYTVSLPKDENFIDLVAYTSPTVFLAAVMLLVGFSRLKFPSWINKCIGVVASGAFSVYLLHAQGPVYQNYIKGKYSFVKEHDVIETVMYVLLIALFWFVLGSALDAFRRLLFKLLRVNKGCDLLGGAVDKLLSKKEPVE